MLLLTVVFLSLATVAQSHWQPAKLSMWTPIAIPCYDSLSTTNAALGIEYKVHNLNGVGGAAVLARHSGDVNGVVVSGVGSLTKGNLRGAVFSILFNNVRDSVTGLMLSGVFNMSLGSMHGVQLSPMNFSIGSVRGFQLTAACNIASSEVHGFQLAGAMNIANTGARAVQITSFVNICLDTTRGVQVAVGNYAGDLHGLQLGIGNMCNGDLKGVQVGVINFSDDTASFRKIGLVNLNPRSFYDVVLVGGNMTNIGLAMRFCNKYAYTMLGVDLPHDKTGDITAALFYRFGGRIPLYREKLYFNPDLGYMHMFKGNNTGDVLEYSLQARISLEYKIQKRLGVFVTGGYAWTSEYGKSPDFTENILLEGGVSFRLPKMKK